MTSLTSVSTTGFVSCPKCGEETVLVITQAEHVSSSYVQHGLNGYVAENDNDSWRTRGKEKFLCDSCGTTWPLDSEISWEWTGD